MPTNPQPQPPEGYSLVEEVPDFLRPVAATTHVVNQPTDNQTIARVSSTNPTEIDVYDPAKFHSPELIHEMTHVFQFSRNPEIVSQMLNPLRTGKIPTAYANPSVYNYGGADGLLAAQRAGKTIADFGPEQQAEIVRNYAVLTKEAIQTGNAAELDKIKQAYGPFIRQLAALPGKNDSMTTMTQKDLTLPAPGLPPATETGILAPDKLLGGAVGVYDNPAEAQSDRNRQAGSKQSPHSPRSRPPSRRDITPPPGYHIED